MKYVNYLCLERVEIIPSGEWPADFPGWCIFCVEAGQGYWLGGTEPRVLNTGDVGALLPLREGAFRASQIGPVTLQYFRFSPEFVGGLLAPAERDSLESLIMRPLHAVRFHCSGTEAARLFSQVRVEDGGGSALMQKAGLLRIIAALYAEELLRPVMADTMFLSARQRLKLLINEIPEAEFLKISSREMAARCGNSLKHFNRSFRKLFGMSLAEKQELIRLQKARQALVETTCRIETLAVDAGFDDVRKFVSAFKNHFGVTPTEWRHPKLRKSKPSQNGSERATA